MPEAIYQFPRGFLWGTATSSHQVEGNNFRNSWHWWEEQGHIIHDHHCGLACDWWGGRWREDFDRAAQGNHNAHRLSIEWSRIQPAPDKWDEEALERYREMVRGLAERNLTPLVTLHHFSEPMWFLEESAWENDQSVEWFTRYTRKVVDALKEYVNLWVTFNEPNLYIIFGYVQGVWPPGKKNFEAAIKSVVNLLRAHASAYRVIHSLQPSARVGMAHHYQDLLPAKEWSPLDRWTTQTLHKALNEMVTQPLANGKLSVLVYRRNVPEAKSTQDFFGLNYYTRSRVAFDLTKAAEVFARRFFPEGADISEGAFIANEPLGFFRAIQWAQRSNLPIIITENGVNDSEDRLRPRYLVGHIHQLWKAVNINIPIKGYFHWSLVDNFEWERGWTQRFGLWALDEKTQQRTRRPSANLYAEICRANGLSSQMVSTYAPEILNQVFPEA